MGDHQEDCGLCRVEEPGGDHGQFLTRDDESISRRERGKRKTAVKAVAEQVGESGAV